MLLLTLIPSTALATETIPVEGNWLVLKGIVKINNIENNTVHAFGIRLFYIEITETERTMGWGLCFNKITFPDDFLLISLIGEISFVIGIGRGELVYVD